MLRFGIVRGSFSHWVPDKMPSWCYYSLPDENFGTFIERNSLRRGTSTAMRRTANIRVRQPLETSTRRPLNLGSAWVVALCATFASWGGDLTLPIQAAQAQLKGASRLLVHASDAERPNPATVRSVNSLPLDFRGIEHTHRTTGALTAAQPTRDHTPDRNSPDRKSAGNFFGGQPGNTQQKPVIRELKAQISNSAFVPGSAQAVTEIKVPNPLIDPCVRN